MPSARFPPEIWQLIIDSLRLHCSCDGSNKPILPGQRVVSWLQWPDPWSDSPTPLAALSSLCRASKTLNHLATPALYHLPITNKPFLLLRTLTDRSELADLVRELHTNMLSGWTDRESERDAYPAAFLDIYDDYHNYILEERPDSRLQLEDRLSDDPDAHGNTINTHVRDTAIVALLPNLTCLSVESHYHELYASLDPGSLPSLTSACVSHGDTEGFLSPLDLCDFAEATPRLARLHLHMAGAGNDDPSLFPFFPRVTNLTMDMSAVSAAAWPCLLDGFPRLKTLVYTGGNPYEYGQGAHARAIQDALVRHRPDLERLCVEFSHVEFFDGSGEAERAFDEGLASLGALRYLIADAASIGSPTRGICVEALPASLRGLRIVCWRPRDPEMVGKALVALAEVKTVRLPELRRVVVVSHQVLPLVDELVSAWDKVGVDFRSVTGDQGLGSWHDLERAVMDGIV